MKDIIVVGAIHFNDSQKKCKCRKDCNEVNFVEKKEDKSKLPIVTITKDFKAHIAHFVPTQILNNCSEECKCRNLHGHTIKVTTIIEGEINSETRMVIDYTILKKTFGKFIDEYIDHRFILPLPMLQKAFSKDEDYMLELIRFQRFLETFYKTEPSPEIIKVIVNEDNNLKEYTYTIGEIIEHDNDKIIAISYKSFTLLNVESTTAEDMAKFFTTILKAMLLKVVPFISSFGVKFYETETSSAEYIVHV